MDARPVSDADGESPIASASVAGALLATASQLRARGEHTEAARYYERAAGLGLVEARYQLGVMQLQAGQLTEAAHSFADAGNLHHLDANLAIGLLTYLSGDVETTAGLFQRVGDRRHPPTLAALGILTWSQGAANEASEHWRSSAHAALRWSNAAAEQQRGDEQAEAVGARHIFISRSSELARWPEHRPFARAAVDAVIRSGDAPVEMTYFPASDMSPEELCAATLGTCDVYIAIVGYEYGTPVRSGGDESYTQLEFRLATDRAMRRFVFVVDDPGLEARAWSDEALRRRQADFRTDLEGSGIVLSFVSDPDELELAVVQALGSLDVPDVVEPRQELFVAADRSVVPSQPLEVVGYRRTGAVVTTSVLLGPESDFRIVPEFPVQMNNGSMAFWTARWSCDHPDVRVAAGFGGFASTVGASRSPEGPTGAGTCGYLSGFITTCPVFALRPSAVRSNVVTVEVQWQYWVADA